MLSKRQLAKVDAFFATQCVIKIIQKVIFFESMDISLAEQPFDFGADPEHDQDPKKFTAAEYGQL